MAVNGNRSRLAASQVKSRHQMSVIRALTGAGGLTECPAGVNNILKVMTVGLDHRESSSKERLGF
jgi:hypothetical protein